MGEYRSLLGEIKLEPEKRHSKKGYGVGIKFKHEICPNSFISTFVETDGDEKEALRILRKDSDSEIRVIAESVSGLRRVFNPIRYVLLYMDKHL
jgi:hypothetical protein